MIDNTIESTKETGAKPRDAERSKNFFALVVLYWLYDRPLDNTLEWIKAKFGKSPELAKAKLWDKGVRSIFYRTDSVIMRLGTRDALRMREICA